MFSLEYKKCIHSLVRESPRKVGHLEKSEANINMSVWKWVVRKES